MFRKHPNAISGFILDEAEVDDNEDDNEDELEEGFSELIAQDRFERDENEDSYSDRRRLQHLMDAEEEDKIEEVFQVHFKYSFRKVVIQLVRFINFAKRTKIFTV